MIRTVGVLLLASCAAFCGIAKSSQLRKTLSELKRLQSFLNLWYSQIRFCKKPLAQLLIDCGSAGQSDLGMVLAQAGRCMERDLSCTPLQAIIQADLNTVLPAEAMHLMDTLFASLGQSDVEGQLQAIGLAQTQLSELLRQIEREQPGRCRSYCALGVSAGFVLIILLL